MKNFGFGRTAAFGDVAADLVSSTDSNTQAGLKALGYFWQKAQTLNPQIPSDFGSFLVGLEQAMCPVSAAAAWPGYTGPYYPSKTDQIFTLQVQGIGQMINTAGTQSAWSAIFSSSDNIAAMPDSQVQSAMQALASAGQGKLPLSLNLIGQFLQDQATQVTFLDAAWYVANAVVATTAQGAQAAGNAVENVAKGALDTLNIFATYELYFIAGGLALAGFVAYKLYLKPMSKRVVGEVKTNPKRRKKKNKKNPCMEGIDGSEVCF